VNIYNESPLVSIVVPCYNHEGYVQACIKSIIDQDYDNIELIIIDDGSKDGSVEKVEALLPECQKRFVRFEFRTRPNKGLCATLNEAIEWCQGELYSAIASDDMMVTHKTSFQVRYFLDNSECDALFSGMYIFDESGEVVRTREAFNGIAKFEDILLKSKSLQAPTQMLRVKALRRVGLYPESLYIEDWYMWLKLSFSGAKIYSVAEPLVFYRRHDSNMSNVIDRMHCARINIVCQYEGHRFYRQGIASCFLSSAIDSQKSDFWKSSYFFVLAVRQWPLVLTQKRSLKYLLKVFYIPFLRVMSLRVRSF